MRVGYKIRREYLSLRHRSRFVVNTASPPLPSLIKGEFEKTVDFKQRVAKAENERKILLQQIETEYQRDLLAYNQAVKNYNRDLASYKANKIKQLPRKRNEFFLIAFHQVHGEPILRDLQYDADGEYFIAQLESENQNFQKQVQLFIPIDAAPDFKRMHKNGVLLSILR